MIQVIEKYISTSEKKHIRRKFGFRDRRKALDYIQNRVDQKEAEFLEKGIPADSIRAWTDMADIVQDENYMVGFCSWNLDDKAWEMAEYYIKKKE